MRVFLVLVTLAVATPAAASPITFTLNGHLTPTTAQSAFLGLIAPTFAANPQFTISGFVEEVIGASTVQLSIGGYNATLLCPACQQSAVLSGQAVNWYSLGGASFLPSLYTTGFTFSMNQGWQSGSFNIWVENPRTYGTNVSGTITTASVPEPSTWLLGMIGALAAWRWRPRSRAAQTA